jgi:hypothetical protein
MPRKQRFKPSRKPKPIPAAQVQEGAEIGRQGVQLDDAGRAPEKERPEPPAADRLPHREEAEAR